MIKTLLLAAIVTNVAPDGVNTIITDTETGVTQSTCVYVWPRNEMPLDPNLPKCELIPGLYIPDEFREGSPQTVLVGGADGRFVVMSEAWYDDLTNRLAVVERVIREDYEKTEAGRVKFHGQRVRTSIDKEALTKTYFYLDGWHYTEKFQKRKASTPDGTVAAPRTPPKRSTNPRYEATRKRREAAKKPVEKTVIHEGGK